MHDRPLADCRLIYLEDDFFLAHDTSETLAEAGAEVVLCSTVSQAINILQGHHFDAALLDLNLAGESSVPVARNLQKAEIPVVFLTGYAREFLPLDLSSCAVLEKPADGSRVVRELEHQLLFGGNGDVHPAVKRH